jgi:hypothetical protein
MSRNALYLAPILVAFFLAIGCGGVAQNPTQPTFNPPNQPAPGAEGTAGSGSEGEQILNQLGGGAQATGENVISGSYEVLWPQGLQSLETGSFLLAGQYFKSALAQNPQSGDAAFAYALTDVMRDYRRYAVFLHPGTDRLFMNTPLVGHPEVLPNPFLAEDSYMLRLASLGLRASKVNPAVQYPVLAPVDTASMFTPENFAHLQMMVNAEGAVEALGLGIPGGDETTAIQDTTGNPQDGDGTQTETPEGSGNTQAASQPDRESATVKHDVGKDSRGKQGDLLSPGTGSGGGPRDLPAGAPGGVGGFSGIGSPMNPPLAGPLPEREDPISEDEWETWLNDYRNAAARDGADIVVSAVFYSNLAALHGEIKEHITNLESIRTIVEAEGYSLSLPLDILDGTQKITLQFDVDDYHMLLDNYRLLDVILSYREAYGDSVPYFLPTSEAVDKNADKILSPDEYLPDTPFGVLNEDGAAVLGSLHSSFLQACTNLNSTLSPLITAAQSVQAGDPEPKELFYLSSFHRNFVLIEEWSNLLREIADKSSTGTAIKIASGAGVGEVVAVYDALFTSPLQDIRIPLPSYDLDTRAIVLDEEGNWSADPTFGGFFYEGLQDAETYTTSGRFGCVVYGADMSKAAKFKLSIGAGSGEAGETGLVMIPSIAVNELIGTPYTVADETGETKGSGLVRTLSEVVMLFDVQILISILQPAAGGVETIMPDSGGTTLVMPLVGDEGQTGEGDETVGENGGDNTEDETGDNGDDGQGGEDDEKPVTP